MHRISLFFVFSLVWHHAVTTICNTEQTNQMMVVALLNIHEGDECKNVSLRGLQHMAVLEKTINDLNTNIAISDGVRLYLNVVDSCSSDGGVKAALKGLVISQQTCRNPPFLIGFIGPEDFNQINSIQQITSAFNKFHALPFAPDYKDPIVENSILYVSNSRMNIRNKLIMTVLNQLKWKSIFIVVGENAASSITLVNLLRDVNHICVTGLMKIPKETSQLNSFYPALFSEYESTGADGVVMLVDDPSNIKDVFKIMSAQSAIDEIPTLPIVLYMNRVGLKSWELPNNFTMIILQEAGDAFYQDGVKSFTNTSLFDEYYRQHDLSFRRDAFQDVLDPSVVPLEYALRLFWDAAKHARRMKCQLSASVAFSGYGVCPEMTNITPSEWKMFLRKANYYDQSSMRKVSFYMDVPVDVHIYVKNVVYNFPQRVGKLQDMGIAELSLDLGKFMKSERSVYPAKCLTTNSSTRIDVTIYNEEDSSWFADLVATFKRILKLDDAGFFQNTNFIYWVIAGVVCMVFLLLIAVIIYKIFKVKGEDEQEFKFKRSQSIRRYSD